MSYSHEELEQNRSTLSYSTGCVGGVYMTSLIKFPVTSSKARV